MVLAAVLSWWHFHPQARPAWVGGWLPTADSAVVTVYRWQDEQGQWHLSDQPPDSGSYETLQLRHDENVAIPAAD